MEILVHYFVGGGSLNNYLRNVQQLPQDCLSKHGSMFDWNDCG